MGCYWKRWVVRSLLYALFITCTLGAQTTERIVLSINEPGDFGDIGALYTMRPDGTGLEKFFDFSGHPTDQSGSLWQVSLSPDGSEVYFVSDNSFAYFPTQRNLFRAAVDGTWWQQLTPLAQPVNMESNCPCGTITGTVIQSSGTPWSNSSVFVQGVPMAKSGGDGRFTMNNVPAGVHVVMAYSPALDRYASTTVVVTANQTVDTGQLQPAYEPGSRLSYGSPVLAGNRLYSRLGLDGLRWSGVESPEKAVEVYKSPICSASLFFDAFDVARQSRRLAIMDYAEGCATNRGLYIADQDGQGMAVFLDMKVDNPQGSGNYYWNGGGDVRWSPDEKSIAMVASYKPDLITAYTYLLVYNSETGENTGAIYFDSAYTLYNVQLFGWDPSGSWLLFFYWLNSPEQGILAKINVKADGSLDAASVQTLIQNRNIGGAAWGNIKSATTGVRDEIISDNMPESIALYDNYPNPFSLSGRVLSRQPGTVIPFTLAKPATVTLQVFDIRGRLVKTLVQGDLPAGAHSISWDGRNDVGLKVSSGTFFYRLHSGREVVEKKMILID